MEPAAPIHRKTLSCRIEPDRLSQLQSYAAARGQTQSAAARQLLLTALERLAA